MNDERVDNVYTCLTILASIYHAEYELFPNVKFWHIWHQNFCLLMKDGTDCILSIVYFIGLVAQAFFSLLLCVIWNYLSELFVL